MSIRLEGYMQTTQQNAPLKRTMKTRHLIMLSLGGVIGTGLFFNTGYIISTTGAAGTLLAYLIGYAVSGRVVCRDAGGRSVSRLCRALSWSGYRVYRGLALLADLDRGAGFELYRRWILYAVLVSTGAGMGLVRGVLRDYFWSECYLHALFFFFLVLVLACQISHYHRLYHPRWCGDFRLYSDAGWLARAGAE